MKRKRAFALALLLALAAPAASIAQSDADHLIDAIFQSFDTNGDGAITTSEAVHFIDKTFSEMDRGKTGRISRDAWLNFSFGLADLAAEQGRSDAYDRAKEKIFRRWDRSKSGGLSLEDYRAGVLGDARAALRGKAKPSDGEMRIDLAAFKRAPFVRQLMRALR
jgi:hypothetical protein